MLLSSYPLMTGEQDWTSSLLNKRTGGYRTFGASAAEAVYIQPRRVVSQQLAMFTCSISSFQFSCIFLVVSFLRSTESSPMTVNVAAGRVAVYFALTPSVFSRAKPALLLPG